ncbi:MAG: hypothetical protein HQM08_13110 [Candidatus Riflebacteria bacterium]|nr:hypothetical protein [Candidatus Riflebacteria bacterium]
MMRFFKLCRYSLLSFFPFFLPIPFILVVFQLSLETEIRRTEDLKNSQIEELERINSHISRISKPEAFFQTLLLKIIQALSTEKSPQKYFQTENGKLIKAFLFNTEGKRILSPGFANESIKISELFLSNLLRKTDPTDKRVLSFAKTAEEIDLITVNRQKLVNLSNVGENKLGGWFHWYKNGKLAGYLIVFVNNEQINVPRLVNKAIQKIQNLAGKNFLLGAISSKTKNFGKSTIIADPRGVLSRNHRLISAIKKSRLNPNFQINEKLVSVDIIPGGIKIFTSEKFGIRNSRNLKNLLFIGIFFIYTFFLFFLKTYRKEVALSIKMEIILVFFLAAILSTTFFFSATKLYHDTKQRNLVREAQKDSEKMLEQIDSNFQPYYYPMVQNYTNLLKRIEEVPEEAMEPLHRLIPLQKQGKILAAFFLGENGDILFKTPEELSDIPKGLIPLNIESFIKKVARSTFFVFNAAFENKSKKSESEEKWDLLLEKAVLRALFNRGNLQNLNLSGNDIITFMDLAVSKSGKAWGVLFILHENISLQSTYLKNIGEELNRNADFHLYGLPKTQKNGLEPVPDSLLLGADSFQTINEHLTRNGNEKHLIGNMSDSTQLFTGIPGKSLMDYNLVLTRPYKPIENQLQSLSRNLLIAGILLVFFGIGTAITLSKQVFQPLQRISKGVENLINLKLDSKIEINSGDELEATAEAINSITQNIQELRLTHIIQDQLLPQNKIETPDFSIKGAVISKKEITKVIQDYFEIDKNKYLIYTGRITGHGLSSALIMSMFKTALRLGKEYSPLTPRALLENLSLFFRNHIKKEIDFSIIASLLSIESGLSISGLGNGLMLKTSQISPTEMENLYFGNDIQLAPELISSFEGAGRAIILSCSEIFQTISLKNFLLENAEKLKNLPFDDFTSIFSERLREHVETQGFDDELSAVFLEWKKLN